jgi:drug/metabolite transporter (DMT)-like permease
MSAFGRLLSNSRFYIVVFLICLSAFVVGFERVYTGAVHIWPLVIVLGSAFCILPAVSITNMLARKIPDIAAQKELWVTLFLCVWLFFVGVLLLLPKVGTHNSRGVVPEKPAATRIHHE